MTSMHQAIRLMIRLTTALFALSAQAQFVQRLDAGPNAINEVMYGFALASHDTRVAVAEPYGLAGGSPVVLGGAVEIWRLHDGAMLREQRLLAPAPGAGHLFGMAVALSADGLAVAERGASGSGGQVHVYRRNGGSWLLQDSLPSAAPTGSSVAAVALLDDWLFMGVVPESNSADVAPGRVLAWQHRNGSWELRQELLPLDSSNADGFGLRLAAPNRYTGTARIVIGAPFRQQSRGAIHVFALANAIWQPEQRLLPPDPTAGERFGFSVAINGDLVVGGTFAEESSPGLPGRISLWRRTGTGDFPWQADNVFGAQDAQPYDHFGHAVALPTEHHLVVGSPGYDVTPGIGPVLENAGASAAYTRRLRNVACPTLWSLTGPVGNPAALARANSRFGWAIAADRLIAVSAPNGEVVGVGRSGFVDVVIQDRLHDSDFDCSH